MIYPAAVVDHVSTARTALQRFEQLAARMPQKFLDEHARVHDLIDAHRVYAWLARGGTGWAEGQLRELDELIASLPASPIIDAKLDELWRANEERVDSLATELLLVRELCRLGHHVELEPDNSGRRPEMLVNGSVLLEAKTFASRGDAVERLTHKLCEDVASGRAFAFDVSEGIRQNHVSPLIRKVGRWINEDDPPQGTVRDFELDGVTLSIEVRYADAGIPRTGSCVVSSPPLPTPEETTRDFSVWLASAIKKARRQTTGFNGRRVLVADVSHMRSAVDMLALRPGLVTTIARECDSGPLEILVAHRLANFANLVFEPPSALRDALR